MCPEPEAKDCCHWEVLVFWAGVLGLAIGYVISFYMAVQVFITGTFTIGLVLAQVMLACAITPLVAILTVMLLCSGFHMGFN